MKSGILLFAVLAGCATAASAPERLIGMYVHQHWPYNHPYAARTWTLEDWRGYAAGLKKLGYNAIMIWPVIETMPDPLTDSDRASLAKMRQVIDMLHKELGMRAWIALCPNIVAKDAEARKAPFEKRHFFYCDLRVNPSDANAVRAMMEWRRKIFQWLGDADAVSIIDSDPGGYPGSTNAEFVNLLVQHRRMFEQLRKRIELIYWMHAGWEAYARFYQTGDFKWAGDAERIDMLERLRKADPAPWGVGNGYAQAEKLGLADRVIAFNYGRIEGEPSFPMTNFGGNNAYEGGRMPGPRGVMGNAQTHCLQLPNTFAFARGATGRSLTEADYVQFANDLIPGQGRVMVSAWQALAGHDPGSMRTWAGTLERVSRRELQTGTLRGLLFGDPQRFFTDLVYQLRLRAAYLDFLNAQAKGADIKAPFKTFVLAADEWQRRHGYQNRWSWPGLEEALRKLNSPAVNAVLEQKKPGPAPFDNVKYYYYQEETFTPRLLEAMKQWLP